MASQAKGRAGQQRKNLKMFAGIVYTEAKNERGRYVERLLRQGAPVIREMMDLLGLDRSPKSFEDGKDSKENMCERIIDFLEEPTSKPKAKPAGGAPKKKQAAKAAPKAEEDLVDKLLKAVAKRQVQVDESAGEANLRDLVAAAEDFVGCKLPSKFKTIVKAVLDDDDEEEEDNDEEAQDEQGDNDGEQDKNDDEPPAKKPKKAPSKSNKKKKEEQPDDDEPAAKKAKDDDDQEDEPNKDDKDGEQADDDQADKDADDDAAADD